MTNPTPQVRRRRIWPWVVAAILAPWLALGLLAWSWLTPSSEVAVLRNALQAASPRHWHTHVQFDIGRGTLAVVRLALLFVPGEQAAIARQALPGVRHVSVGVYEGSKPDRGTGPASAELTALNERMRRHGWSPFLRVIDAEDTVLGYVPDKAGARQHFSLAVLSDEHLVVISGELEPEALGELTHLVAGGKLPPRPQVARP